MTRITNLPEGVRLSAGYCRDHNHSWNFMWDTYTMTYIPVPPSFSTGRDKLTRTEQCGVCLAKRHQTCTIGKWTDVETRYEFPNPHA